MGMENRFPFVEFSNERYGKMIVAHSRNRLSHPSQSSSSLSLPLWIRPLPILLSFFHIYQGTERLIEEAIKFLRKAPFLRVLLSLKILLLVNVEF